MKNIFATLIIVAAITTLLVKCQDSYLTDLTPDDGFGTSWYFHTPAFNAALENVVPADPAGSYEIDQPEGLINRNPFLDSIIWHTTDTFAFEKQDFQIAINTIHATIDTIDIQNAYPSPKLAWVDFAGRGGYSMPGEYWLIPYWKAGKRYFIQITGEKTSGSGWWSQYRYTANGLWMEGKEKPIKGDVS